ncbi:MAG: PAS domain S-box protein, partial [Candidatus Hydrogenedentes bacterium]|nr:PAS domain S-box protein [Candidatus Hydrogenedentota bacterium]
MFTNLRRLSPLTIVLLYILVSGLWVVCSDRAVVLVAPAFSDTVWLQTLKGWLFITFTGAMLYVLLHMMANRILERETANMESQRMLSTLMSNLPGMVYRCQNDPNWTMEFVSEGGLALTGYEPSEIVSGAVTYESVIHAEDRARVRETVHEAISAKTPYQATYRIVTAGGETRWVWEQGEGVWDSAGELEALEGFVADITVRKNAEAEVKRKERYYRSLIENAQDVIVVLSSDMHIQDISPGVKRMFGYEPEELMGAMALDFIHGDDRPTAARLLSEAAAEPGVARSFEHRTLCKDGSWRTAETKGKAIVDDGKIILILNMRDMTERIAVESTNQRLAAVVEYSADAVMITDTSGVIQYVNPAFEKVTGYSEEEALGQTPRLMKSGCHDPAFYMEMWNVLGQGEVWMGQITNRHKDGHLIEERVSIAPIKGRDGMVEYYVAIKRDVTQINRLEAQIRQSQKLEAIGNLAGGIAHDFNNILSAILGYSEMALGEADPESNIAEDIREVITAGTRAKQLVQQILMFSREAEVDKHPIQLQSVVKETLKLLRATLPTTMDFVVDLDNHCENVYADPTQMHQVLMNLCTNAYYAMREKGGVLRIQLRAINLDEISVQQHVGLHPGRHVCLTVSDTGHGMTREVMERIFEPFFSTKKHEGTGLGLSTVHGIVRSHNGAITVYSDPGHGTSFNVYLPCVVRQIGQENATVEALPQGAGEHVLFVDDEEVLVRLGKQLLERMGYR